MKLVILSALHFAKGSTPEKPFEQGRNADIFLLRTVHRINRWIKPDAVIIHGPLTDPPDPAALEELANYVKMLKMPVFVMRTASDLPSEQFYQIMPRSEDFLDVEDYRLIPADHETFCNFMQFNDPARRAVFIHPEDFTPPSCSNAVTLPAAPPLCCGKFPYLVVTLEADTVQTETEELALPDGLFDSHMHSRYAYCAENLDIHRQLDLIRAFNLEHFALTEHSGHLYVSKQAYWDKTMLQRNGLANSTREERVKDYLALLDELDGTPGMIRGFELDVDRFGNVIVEPEDLKRVDLKVGAVHWLDAGDDREAMKADFLMRTEALMRAGCHVIAHPFRVFGWSHPPIPTELFEPMMKLFKKYGVAAEINFHYNMPEPDFFRLCLENGVKLAFGSDTHNLYELGEFYANLKFLKEIGGSKNDLFRFDF